MDVNSKQKIMDVIMGIFIIMFFSYLIVIPAYAEPSNRFAEQEEAMKSADYLKYQWSIQNFELFDGHTTFWISNDNAPEIKLKEVVIKDHDTGQNIPFSHTDKVTKEKKPTASIWNFFGLFDPKDQLSKDQMLQVIIEGDYQHNKNIDVISNDVIITHYGIME